MFLLFTTFISLRRNYYVQFWFFWLLPNTLITLECLDSFCYSRNIFRKYIISISQSALILLLHTWLSSLLISIWFLSQKLSRPKLIPKIWIENKPLKYAGNFADLHKIFRIRDINYIHSLTFNQGFPFSQRLLRDSSNRYFGIKVWIYIHCLLRGTTRARSERCSLFVFFAAMLGPFLCSRHYYIHCLLRAAKSEYKFKHWIQNICYFYRAIIPAFRFSIFLFLI